MSRMESFQSQRGGRKMIFEGYVYNRRAQTKTNELWYCANRKNHCEASAKTVADEVLKVTEHNHFPDFTHANSVLAKARAYEAARNGVDSIRNIVKSLPNNGLSDAVVAKLPKLSSLARTARRQKKKQLEELMKQPGYLEELERQRVKEEVVEEEGDPLLKDLNNCTLVEVDGVWYDKQYRYLVTPPGFDKVQERVFASIDNILVRVDPEIAEPRLIIFPNINDIFGFVDMSGAVPDEVTNYQVYRWLSIKCPKGCSADVRKWVCDKCGDIVRAEHVHLFCRCGSKFFGCELVVCNHPNH